MTKKNRSFKQKKRISSNLVVEEVVAQMPQNFNEEILFKLTTYKGKVGADIRTHYRGPDGELLPGPKGNRLKIDRLETFSLGVRRLLKRAKELQLPGT